METIDILLATHNGEAYLEEQIKSILSQTHKNWNLIIHDDNSNDKTKEILKTYTSKYPEKITFIDDGVKNGGAKENFSHLLNFSKSEYIMFCDQDDIWLPNKIKNAYTRLKHLENSFGSQTPLIAYSDLTVVDENLITLEKSFHRILFKINEPKINQLLVQNVSPGCSMIFNKALLKKAYPIPKEAIMHDWWFILIASVFGQISFIETQDILYRQHSKNTVGFSNLSIAHILDKISKSDKIKISIDKTIVQAASLLVKVPPNHKELKIIDEYSKINKKNKFKRCATLLNNKIKKQRFVQTLGLYIFI